MTINDFFFIYTLFAIETEMLVYIIYIGIGKYNNGVNGTSGYGGTTNHLHNTVSGCICRFS